MSRSERDPSTVSIRLPLALHKAIMAYCDERKLTLTQVTLDHYRRLLAEENRQEAEQV